MNTKPTAKLPLIKINRKQPIPIRIDIIEAAAHAYLKALNKADQERNL